MELTKANIKDIREAFLSIETREHLLYILNYVKPFVYGEKAVPFELKQLTYYSRQRTNHYKDFKIKKKSGSYRTIHAPVQGLKAIQKTLAFVLQCVFEPHTAATGFVKEKSIVDNAKLHVGHHYVYNLDLKDFFPSIDQARVWKCLQLKPFLLNDEHPTDFKNKNKNKNKSRSGVKQFTTEFGETIFYQIEGSTVYFINDKKENYSRLKKRIFTQLDALKKDNEELKTIENLVLYKDYVLPDIIKKYISTEDNLRKIKFLNDFSRIDLAGFISNICCTKMIVERIDKNGEWGKVEKNVLPQGAPTSPVLTNVVCQRLDYLLTAVAKRFGLKYSRYADDITFSSLHNVFQESSPFLNEMRRVIKDQGFILNENKTRLQVDGIRKEVTGLVVNKKVNVKKRYIKDLRKWLYLWERYGYAKAKDIFKRDYIQDKGHVKKGNPNLSNVIDGKLNYLQMVKGSNDSTFIKLKYRYELLIQEMNPLELILKEWELNGIDSAMKKYKVSAMMNKFNFVKQLLENEKFKPSQKERFLKLISNELVDFAEFDEKVFNEVMQNKDRIKLLEDSFKESMQKQKKQTKLQYPKTHNARTVVKLMNQFSDNAKALKYTTHSWEHGRFHSYEDFMKKIKVEWNEFSQELKVLNPRLHGKISNFLFNSKLGLKKNSNYYHVWGDKQLKFGWASKALETYMQRAESDPFSCPIPEEIKSLDGKYQLLSFDAYVNEFKNEIEIREDNSALVTLINTLWTDQLTYDFDVVQQNTEGVSFFTDVPYLKSVLKVIFGSFKKRPEFKNIVCRIDEYFDNNYVELCISQLGSKCRRSINDHKIISPNGGDFSTLIENLNNLADFSVLGEFKDGFIYKVNYLSSNEGIESVEKLKDNYPCTGFTYILKFYL